MYKEGIPALGVSFEMGTPDVPDDGQFHVILDGQVLASYKTERAARRKYTEIREARQEETGYQTDWSPPDPEELRRRARAEHDLRAVMSESARSRRAKATRKGGKGGSGGV